MDITDFSYNRTNYKNSFLSWVDVVNSWVDDSKLDGLVDHFHTHYGLTETAIRQHIKRLICCSYDFTTANFTKSYEISRFKYESAMYIGKLGYLLFYSKPKKQETRNVRVLVDNVENVSEELKVFNDLFEHGRGEMILSVTNRQEYRRNTEVGDLYSPWLRGYESQSVIHALRTEGRYGVKLYESLSRNIGANIFNISFSLINQWLYYKTLYSKIAPEITLTWRDYNFSSISRDMVNQLYNGKVCAVQRGRHGFTTLACFMDFDLYLPFGQWFSDLSVRLHGRIGKSCPVGSLLAEPHFNGISIKNSRYDVLFIDSGWTGNNFYEGYKEDILEVYGWLKEITLKDGIKSAIKTNKGLLYAAHFQRRDRDEDTITRVINDYKRCGIEVAVGDSYRVALSAKVVIVHHTSMGYELGSKVPVVFCNPGRKFAFLPDLPEFSEYVVHNYEDFRRKLQSLLQGNKEELEKYTSGFEYFGANSEKTAKNITKQLLI